jgi:4-aminobutyrate aminotransferase-like enzyme
VCRLSGSGYAALGDLVSVQRPQWKDIKGTIGMEAMPRRSGDDASSSGPPNQDQARLRRRGALVGRSAASSVFRLRPPLTGSNKAG